MPRALNHILPFIIAALSICLLSSSGISQQPPTVQLPAPPPMRFVTRGDRSQLDSAKESKARVRLTMELAAAQLSRMEQLTNEKEFDHASEVLGNYLGLIEDVKTFLGGLAPDKNATRDLYRHLDITLRAQIPRLTVMRRETPSEYAVHIKSAEEFIRDTRSSALDGFYGHTVLRPDIEKKADAAKDRPEETKRP